MVQYYYKPSEGSDQGPIGDEEFRQRQATGEITAETMVWRSGMGDWKTCAAMRADEERAAQPKVPAPRPQKPKPASTTTSVRPKGSSPCAMCGQDWPESLLIAEGGQQICGNCVNRKKMEMQNGPKIPAVSGWKAWTCIIISVGCFITLYYRVSHYGIGPAMKAKELSEPAKYGR